MAVTSYYATDQIEMCKLFDFDLMVYRLCVSLKIVD